MAKWDIDHLKRHSMDMLTKHSVMMTLYQTLAEHFYPERADFTVQRNTGLELADNLVDSYPILVRRDLGNSFNAMLRDGDWFSIDVNGDSDYAGSHWLQHSTRRLKQLMNRRESNFVRSTKEGDHDYATFGSAVISVELNKAHDGLLYRCWHLRDCAWFDGEDGQVAGVVRKWSATAYELISIFGTDKNHPKISESIRKDGQFNTVNVRHIVLPSDMYGDEDISTKFKYVSIFLDIDNNHIIEEQGLHHKYYVIPRFQTIAGSPYPYSPATVAGLPTTRTLQAMTHTLLEAGERYTRPPLVGNLDVIRGDVDLASDGVTWVDKEYDERLGASLRPLTQNTGGFPIGLELREDTKNILKSAFYLNTISLPETTRDMTATEVIERMKQYRRENLPLFAPLESEYNGQLCEVSFDIALRAGFFGSPMDIPDSLKGSEVRFKFISPLSQSDEENRANRFNQSLALTASASQHDPDVKLNIDFDTALRDALDGMGIPATWLNSEEEVSQARQVSAMQKAAMMTQQGGVDES